MKKILTLILLIPISYSFAKAQASVDTERIEKLSASIDASFYAITPKGTTNEAILNLKSGNPSFPIYLYNAYYDNGASVPSIVLQKADKNVMLRIGEASLLIEKIDNPQGVYYIPTDMVETVYYFLNDTLVKTTQRMGYTEQGSSWVNTVSVDHYYQGKEVVYTSYTWNDQVVTDIDNHLKQRLIKEEDVLMQRASLLFKAYKSEKKSAPAKKKK